MYNSNKNRKVSFDVRQLLGKYQFQLKLYPWITIHQKKWLIEYTGLCQVNFFVLNLTQNPLHIFRLVELFVHNLLFQLSVIEFLIRHIKYRRLILKNCFVKKGGANLTKWLGELKYFRHKRVFSLKRISIASANKKKQRQNIYCKVDLLIQQLFVLVLSSRVKANTELNNYNLNPPLFLVKSISKIRNSLYYKLWIDSEMFGHTSLGTCFHLLNYTLLLKNIFVPFKYEYIFKSWSNFKQVKYSLMQTNNNNLKIFPIGIIGFLWMNSVFNAIYRLIYGVIIKSKTSMCDNFLRKVSSNALKLLFQSKLLGNSFVKRFICWDFFWGIKSFAVLSNSRKFLSILVRKVQSFLFTQSLQVQIKIYRIIWVRANTNFHLLGSIFSGSTKSIIVRKRLLYAINKVHRSQFQRKLLFYRSVTHTNFLKFVFTMYEAVSRHYSVYNIILVLNSIVIKWMDYCTLNFQKTVAFVKSWLCRWLLLWVKRQCGKKFKTLLSRHFLFIKYFGFRNHLETLRHLTEINCIFLTNFFFFGFVEVSQKNFKHWCVAVPQITAVWAYLFPNRI